MLEPALQLRLTQDICFDVKQYRKSCVKPFGSIWITILTKTLINCRWPSYGGSSETLDGLMCQIVAKGRERLIQILWRDGGWTAPGPQPAIGMAGA